MAVNHTARPSRPARPHTIVPAPVAMLRSYPGELDGLAVLDEVEPAFGLPGDDSLALLLWHAVRRVYTWAALSPERREGLSPRTGSAPTADIDQLCARTPQLAGPLHVFATLATSPNEVERNELADACEAVGRWAAELGLMRTAVHFAEVAAAAEPENAARTIEAGEMCQRLGGPGLMERAEQWFQRSFGLARVATRSRKLLCIRSLLAYGNWALEKGNRALARKCFESAARRARRYERWRRYAIAHHNLLHVAYADSPLSECEHLVREALSHYPARCQGIYRLAHDYAFVLLRERHFAPALRLLRPLPLLLRGTNFELLASGSVAWAAACAGESTLFEEAKRATLSLVGIYEDFAAPALLHLAEGAERLGLASRAGEYADLAAEYARRRGSRELEAEALELRRRVDAGGEPQNAVSAPCPEATEALVHAFLGVLPSTGPEPVGEAEVVGRSEAAERVRKAGTRRKRLIPPMPELRIPTREAEINGAGVLREVEEVLHLSCEVPLAVTLWMAWRRVLTWSEFPPERRHVLSSGELPLTRERFAYWRGQAPALADALGTFASLLRAPHLMQGAHVAAACEQVRGWAAEQAFFHTALHFAEAAARANCEDPALAITAGEACQRIGGPEMLGRAEVWLERALVLAHVATRSRRLMRIRSLLAYGNWALAVGRGELAQGCYEKAAAKARRHERWRYVAVARHNLLHARYEDATLEECEEYVAEAVHHYARTDENLPKLAHDYAFVLVRQGVYAPALPLLIPLAALLTDPGLVLLAHSTRAWAAAGAGRTTLFREATQEALGLLSGDEDFGAVSLLHLAEAARLAGDLPAARTHAHEAAERSRRRDSSGLEQEALELLAQMQAQAPPVQAREPSPRTAALVRMLASRLTDWAPEVNARQSGPAPPTP